jgi:hypothetical protein
MYMYKVFFSKTALPRSMTFTWGRALWTGEDREKEEKKSVQQQKRRSIGWKTDQ